MGAGKDGQQGNVDHLFGLTFFGSHLFSALVCCAMQERCLPMWTRLKRELTGPCLGKGDLSISCNPFYALSSSRSPLLRRGKFDCGKLKLIPWSNTKKDFPSIFDTFSTRRAVIWHNNCTKRHVRISLRNDNFYSLFL